jgi:hypothetical protein
MGEERGEGRGKREREEGRWERGRSYIQIRQERAKPTWHLHNLIPAKIYFFQKMHGFNFHGDDVENVSFQI